MLTVRLCDEDRATYSAPDPLLLDPEQVKDAPVEDLEDMETESESSIVALLDVMQADGRVPTSVRFRRLAAWYALRMSGDLTAWAKFTPKILRAQFTWTADPPAGRSTGSSAELPSGATAGP